MKKRDLKLLQIEREVFNSKFEKPNYSHDAFRAAVKIFVSALLDKAWDSMDASQLNRVTRIMASRKLAEDVRSIVYDHTEIDIKKYF